MRYIQVGQRGKVLDYNKAPLTLSRPCADFFCAIFNLFAVFRVPCKDGNVTCVLTKSKNTLIKL